MHWYCYFEMNKLLFPDQLTALRVHKVNNKALRAGKLLIFQVLMFSFRLLSV